MPNRAAMHRTRGRICRHTAQVAAHSIAGGIGDEAIAGRNDARRHGVRRAHWHSGTTGATHIGLHVERLKAGKPTGLPPCTRYVDMGEASLENEAAVTLLPRKK